MSEKGKPLLFLNSSANAKHWPILINLWHATSRKRLDANDCSFARPLHLNILLHYLVKCRMLAFLRHGVAWELKRFWYLCTGRTRSMVKAGNGGSFLLNCDDEGYLTKESNTSNSSADTWLQRHSPVFFWKQTYRLQCRCFGCAES